jgi:uncharacterized protein YqgV (UPF0045/DUF77 family)
LRIAVDVSLYPLAEDFIPPINDVIRRLTKHASIEVTTNPMSTQIRGEYADVMAALNQEIQVTFETVPKAVFAIRILNNPLGDQ